MKTLYSSVDIDASPQHVWDILIDFAAYPTWNPFITRIAGTPVVGSRLDARLEPPGGMGITMHPTVLEVVPGSALRWLGHLLVSGVFDGEHHFVLEPLETNRTRLVQQERFRGLLVPGRSIMAPSWVWSSGRRSVEIETPTRLVSLRSRTRPSSLR